MTKNATHHPLSRAWAAARAAGDKQRAREPFVHQPRAPFVPAAYADQRWYAGGGSDRIVGTLGAITCGITLCVRGNKPTAELQLSTFNGTDDFRISTQLTAHAMRELARSLIDAATDLDNKAMADLDRAVRYALS